MVIIQKKSGGTWWKCLLSFFAGLIFVPVAIAVTVAYAGTQMKAKELLGPYADTVLTVEYQEKTAAEIVNDFLSQRVDYNTLGGLAKVTPLIDTYLEKLSNKLNEETGIELDLEELKTKQWLEIPNYLVDAAKHGVKLGKIFGVDESSDNIMKSLCYEKNDDGTFNFDHPYTIADFLDDPHFIQNKVDSLTIKDVIGDSGEGASKVIKAIEDKTIKQLKNEDVFGDLKVSDIVEVTDSSSNVLKAIKDKTINELKNDDVFGDLLVSDVIDIDDSSAQVLKTFKANGTKVKELGDAIDDMLLSEVIEINDSSPKILKTFKEKGTKVKDMSSEIDNMYLSDAYESDDPDNLPPVMKKLLGNSADPVLATGSPLMAHIDYETYSEVIFSNGLDKTIEGYEQTGYVNIKDFWTAHDIAIEKTVDGFVVHANGTEDRSALATREFDIQTAIPSEWTSLYVTSVNKPVKIKELDKSIDDLSLKDVVRLDSTSPLYKVRHSSIKDADQLFTDIKKSLTIKDIFGDDLASYKFINKIDENTTIENIGPALNNMKLVDAFEDNIYDNSGNLTSMWKYLLIEAGETWIEGNPNKSTDPFSGYQCKTYTVNGDGVAPNPKGINQMMDNMKYWMENQKLRVLQQDHMISIEGDLLTSEIPATIRALDTGGDIIPLGAVYYGDLTTKQFVELMTKVPVLRS